MLELFAIVRGVWYWNGHGYVKAHRGFYRDAIFVKRNNFNLLLHETFGGGFSPTAVLKLRRLARKAARGSVDRTA